MAPPEPSPTSTAVVTGAASGIGADIAGLPSQLSTRLFQFMPRRVLLPLLRSRHPGLRRDRSTS